MTAFREAFLAAGYKPIDYEVAMHIIQFYRAGGTIARLHEIGDECAKRIPGVTIPSLSPAKVAVAGLSNPGKPLEGEGDLDLRVRNYRQSSVSPPSSNRERGDHWRRVTRPDQSGIVAVAREPSSGQRIAAAVVAKQAALTVLDTFKIDGRPIGDWGIGEALRAGKDMTYHGRILLDAARFVANANHGAKIRAVLKSDDLQRIIQRAAETADAA